MQLAMEIVENLVHQQGDGCDGRSGDGWSTHS